MTNWSWIREGENMCKSILKTCMALAILYTMPALAGYTDDW